MIYIIHYILGIDLECSFVVFIFSFSFFFVFGLSIFYHPSHELQMFFLTDCIFNSDPNM